MNDFMGVFGFFERRVAPFPKPKKSAPPSYLIAFIWHFVSDAKGWLFALAMLAVLLGISEVLIFGFIGQLVDWLTTAHPDVFLEDYGFLLAVMAMVVIFAMPLGSFLSGVIIHQVLYGNLAMSARWRMHSHLLGQSLSFYSEEFPGRVSAKVMQTAMSIRDVVLKFLDVFVFVSIFFVSTIILVASADLRLVIPLVIWFLAYIGLIAWFVPRLTGVAEQQADARSDMTGRVVDSYSNIKTVKLFDHSGDEEAYARSSMQTFLGTVHGQFRLITGFYILINLNNAVCVLSIAALGIGFWTNEAISAGAIAAALGLSLRISGMSQWIMWEVSTLFQNIGVIYDGMSMLSLRHAVEDKNDAVELVISESKIEFENVSFRYNKEVDVIDDLSLQIAGGEKIGLVGHSGAGKSTIANLLLRFYDVDDGDIWIDGQSIKDVTQTSLRKQISMVSQDTSLLHRSIRENVKYGAPNTTDEQVWAAIRRADADRFISEIADSHGRKGLDALVGERGVNLSGGQRQRIAIARVFLQNAPILILDEATSALDSEAEAVIQKNLFELTKGKTVIAIAHRLSTIAEMDRLVVLQQGRIEEIGTHSELINRGGRYTTLWERQSGGFLIEESKQLDGELSAESEL
jgi:ATP-binding cassette subfamily B multidrug efflux pump